MAEAFSDEELKLKASDLELDAKMISSVGVKIYNTAIARFLATITADRKRIEGLKEDMAERTRLWHNANIEVKNQTAVIERLRDAIERLASSEALGSPGVIPDELRLRMIYADMVLESGEPLSAIEKEVEEGEHQRIMANAKRRQALDAGKE